MSMVGSMKLAYIPLASAMFDRKNWGRRPLLIYYVVAMSLALFGLSVQYFTEGATWKTIALLFAYMAFFSMGPGPGAWLIPSEVFATSMRAKAVSLATCSNRVAATMMSSTVLSLATLLGWGEYFLLLAVICLLLAFVMHLGLPETKGKTLEDMTRYFLELSHDKSSVLCSEGSPPPPAAVQEVELSTKRKQLVT